MMLNLEVVSDKLNTYRINNYSTDDDDEEEGGKDEMMINGDDNDKNNSIKNRDLCSWKMGFMVLVWKSF